MFQFNITNLSDDTQNFDFFKNGRLLNDEGVMSPMRMMTPTRIVRNSSFSKKNLQLDHFHN